jgi:hypothetical protein
MCGDLCCSRPTVSPSDNSEDEGSAAAAAAEKFKLYGHYKHHQEIAKLMKQRVESASIFGQTWKSILGFFAPYGTDNCFWNRLKKSPSFRHLFIYNHTSLRKLVETPLSEVADVAPLTVTDVDSFVNTSALVCALLLSIPSSIMSAVGGQPDSWQAYVEGMTDRNSGAQCALPFSELCLHEFKNNFEGLHVFVITCFYSCLLTLFLAFCYYMCRPAESCNTSSFTTLLGAFTLEVRDSIRSEKRGLSDTDATTEVSPQKPFSSAIEELEVFMKANVLATAELEEQKNQEFYCWYKSEALTRVLVRIFYCACLYAFVSIAVTGGRLCVLGIFFGLLASLVTCCFAVNFYFWYFFSFNPDAAIFPIKLYHDAKISRYVTMNSVISFCIIFSAFVFYTIV